MTDILHFVGTDPQERKQIENEQEAWRSYYAMYGEKEGQFQKELEKQRIKLIEKDQVINEKDQIIAELMKKLNEKN